MSDAESTEPTGATLADRRGDLARFLLTWFALPSALVIALLIGGVMMLVLGANPITGYVALVKGAFGGSYALSSTAIQAVPLLLVGLGICIAFRASVFNIGGEGQIAMGGLAGVEVKSIRKEDQDAWDLQARRLTVPFVQEPGAGYEITGVVS